MKKSIVSRVRAFSARKPCWQMAGASGSQPAMRSMLLALPVLAWLSSAPAGAVPGGKLGTLDQGHYVCELPGDAGGPTRIHVPDADFKVISASSYRSKGIMGSYLLTGDRVVMTSGPHRGRKFRQVSEGFLRETRPDGTQGAMRCVRTP